MLGFPLKYWLVAAAVLFALVVTLSIVLSVRRVHTRRKNTSPEAFNDKWKELQKLCAHKETWPDAVRAADDLLGEALRKKHFRGGSIGERLTKAQRQLSNNENAWFGHKLRSKIDSGIVTRLAEKDVKLALAGIRQALRDLGVLKNDK